jgi:hypothetical protein
MLYTNLSVQSTLLEGFTANGSLGYAMLDQTTFVFLSSVTEQVPCGRRL